jgi:hypothetical protein
MASVMATRNCASVQLVIMGGALYARLVVLEPFLQLLALPPRLNVNYVTLDHGHLRLRHFAQIAPPVRGQTLLVRHLMIVASRVVPARGHPSMELQAKTLVFLVKLEHPMKTKDPPLRKRAVSVVLVLGRLRLEQARV